MADAHRSFPPDAVRREMDCRFERWRQGVVSVTEQVRMLYVVSDDEHPAIRCPWCEKQSVGWERHESGHVWFTCEHCGEGFIQ